jgi:ribosomal protein S18 acetylase RimI-like enzyme
MADLIQACSQADDQDDVTDLASVERTYRHLVHCDPDRDMIMAEVGAALIAYGRGWWEDEWSGTRTYRFFVNLHPDWRKHGIGRAMLRWIEARMREVAATHPEDTPKAFQSGADEAQAHWHRLLEDEGYAAVRWGHLMVRSLAEPIAACPLPPGLEVRPVQEADISPIWRAAEEAFRDHWGHGEWKDEYLAEWRESPTFQPHLWQVAWDNQEVAGMVLNRFDAAENAEYGRLRGYTETICVRRPWRGRGLARALITRSLSLWKSMGMTEAAHGVDSQNATGALALYKSLGYRVTRTFTTYRKTLE